MNIQSTILQTFIKNQGFTKISNKNKPFKFTASSKIILKNIYKILLEAEQEWTKIPAIHVDELDGAQIKVPYFVPDEIQDKIKKQNLGFKYPFQLKRRHITIHIVLPNNTKKTQHQHQTDCEQIVKRMYMWLYIADHFACKSCSKTMNIYVYMTDHLKRLPKNKREPIDVIHANTAFTTACSENTDIHLFRSEEMEKVFIHETFHNLGLDFSSVTNQLGLENQIRAIFPLNIPDIRAYESYCEVWAEVMNIMFIAHMTSSIEEHKITKILGKMEPMIQLERTFSLFQCSKILNHYGLTYRNIIDTSFGNKAKLSHYKENTNAFSYYVLKPILLYHLNEFLDWSENHNKNMMDFRKTDKNMMAYGDLIKQLYNDDEYLAMMDNLDAWFYQDSGVGGGLTNETEFIRNTLRMTLNEI